MDVLLFVILFMASMVMPLFILLVTTNRIRKANQKIKKLKVQNEMLTLGMVAAKKLFVSMAEGVKPDAALFEFNEQAAFIEKMKNSYSGDDKKKDSKTE